MSENLNILLAQTNPIVGNIEHNRDLVLDIVSKNKNADLIIFTELVLSGYPPEDLVLKSAFQNKVCDAFHEIMDASVESESYIIIGSLWVEGGKLYNSSLFIEKGNISAIRHKHDLPNYGVFDEKRVFESGPCQSF